MGEGIAIAHRIAAVAYSSASTVYTGCWIYRHLISPLIAGSLPTGVLHYSSSDPLGWLIFMFVIAPLVLLAFAGNIIVLLMGTVLRRKLSSSVYGAACTWLSCFQGVLSFMSLQGCLSFELGPHGNLLVVTWWIAAIVASIGVAVFSIIAMKRTEGA